MIAIIDYKVGNLFSLYSSLKYLGIDSVVVSDKKSLREADKIILPGVGAFSDAKQKLLESGMLYETVKQANEGKPILGICLGMQMLFDKSFEYGEHEGLKLIEGNVVSLADEVKNLKIPQMGWNKLEFGKPNPLFKYTKRGDYVYFVHSYYAKDCEESVIATTEYGIKVTAAVNKDNIYGVQFHPEKSGKAGLNILKAFSEII